jgi:hypothetical protein
MLNQATATINASSQSGGKTSYLVAALSRCISRTFFHAFLIERPSDSKCSLLRSQARRLRSCLPLPLR